MMAITNLIQFNNLRGDVTTAVIYPWLWTSALPLGWESLGGLYGAVRGSFLAALFNSTPDVDLCTDRANDRKPGLQVLVQHLCCRGEAPHCYSL